jgi:hypothetical protein
MWWLALRLVCLPLIAARRQERSESIEDAKKADDEAATTADHP